MSELRPDVGAHRGESVRFPALPLPALLRRRARECPADVAVRDAETRLTYAELVDGAHRLAARLGDAGVAPGDRVMSALPRGVPGVLAQVAVLAAGAVHVPVDAEYPAGLLHRMTSALGVRCVLGLREQDLPAGPHRIDLDDPESAARIAALPATPPDRDPPLDATAFVLHTSGTSGRPKAVALSHAAYSNSMQAFGHRYPGPVGTSVTSAPPTFDAFIGSLWWTLLAGGTVRLLPPAPGAAIEELISALSVEDVAQACLTPSLYRTVLPAVGAPSPTLRQVILVGEACGRELVADHHLRMPGVELISQYGPAEAAVWCTSATLGPGDEVTVGTAIANTELLVLDDGGAAVPDGRPGEVCVAGPNLGEGYLGDPELTRDRFVPHPSAAGGRVYRTGDLGRWRPDGRLELHGRIDQQVKVRGLRVEPEGVAAVLRDVAGVRDAVVVQRTGRLIAYVVPERDERDEQDAAARLLPALRERAAERLPAHERPAACVIVADLPVTRHGKLDASALPAPPAARPELSTPYVRPVSETERAVALVIAELLRIDEVGAHDDFVELGGDSLRAVWLAGRLSERFGADLGTRAVFDAPTAARLAALITARGPRHRPATAAPGGVQAPPGAGRLPLSPAQVFAQANDPARSSGPLFLLETRHLVRGPLDRAALAEAVDQTVAAQAGLRVGVRLTGTPQDAHQVVCPPPTGVLRVLEARGSDPASVLAAHQSAEPLNVPDGRVFAADLVRVTDDEHLLALRLHHLVGDAVSVGILEQEIGRRYAAVRAGKRPVVPPSDYAALVAPAPSVPRPEDTRFWSERVAGCGPVALIPAEVQGGTADSGRRVRSVLVPAEPARAFLRMARARRLTFASALYAPLCAIVAADTGDPDTRLLVATSLRSEPLAHTIGWVTDLVLVRHRTRPGRPVPQALDDAHRDLHEALRHDSVSLFRPGTLPPEMGLLLARSQFVTFDVLPPVTGLNLDGCSILRQDMHTEGFQGTYDFPGQLIVMARQEDDRIRLIAAYDSSFAPDSYVRGLLERLRHIVAACGRPGSPPLDELTEPWPFAAQETSGSAPRG
ncbi:hypothetical protein BJF79_08030 [Actinomadura sp. CNU-125]|uniref:non-ribosomal peptide synthetase n=1 Tax=Actinomadura sp. CNU-125 TaxID=1904961 RepID=UPI00095FE7A4|nr:non-ribosomal peptide synthetase [Actinomadura sp. CNU-125]OLT33220.1 hypothetical protein BJF79_08030 [Actinomadura sp. CNU-125]